MADQISSVTNLESISATEPFLRWAGGKSWFIRRFGHLFPSMANSTYHEPFLGGGAVFFGIPTFRAARLSDQNARLIETYVSVRDSVDDVIAYLNEYENTKECYYTTREKIYATAAQRAAQFIYLNQTSFNGIYRVNLKGVYNVPYGFRTKPFLDEIVVRAANERLQNTDIYVGDFYQSVHEIKKEDLVFIDPPYTVSHNKNGFIKYNERLFALKDFYRLRQYICEIREIGARYIMTNAAHDDVRDIFDIGDVVVEASRASLVGGRGAQRGAVGELVFTNVEGFGGNAWQR